MDGRKHAKRRRFDADEMMRLFTYSNNTKTAYNKISTLYILSQAFLIPLSGVPESCKII